MSEPSAPEPGAPVLPDATTDEGDIGWGEHPAYDDDQRLLDERPPHHDRD
jgi:hypothetical protein